MKRAAINLLFIACILIAFQRCAPSRYVKPLEKNQMAASFSFGGPLIHYSGAAIPLPFSTLGYGYGINDKVTAFGNWHTTSALFGNLQFDAGATIGLTPHDLQYGLSISPALQFAFHPGDKGSARLWPTLDLNYFYHFNQKPSYVYAGFNGWLEVSNKRAHNEDQPRHVIPNIHAGYNLVKNKWIHQFELKYLGIGIANLPGVVEYVGIAQKGSFGIYYSLIRKF